MVPIEKLFRALHMTDFIDRKNITLAPYRLATFEEALRALWPGPVALDLETYSINSHANLSAALFWSTAAPR